MTKLCLKCEKIIPKISKQWNNQKFCCTRCRKNHFRKQKASVSTVQRREANLLINEEMAYIIRQCRYAGTVQILSGHDLESFCKTMNLIKERPVGYVHLCHIAPVKNKYIIGLLHHENLFYGGDYQNRKLRNIYLGDGFFIYKSTLEDKWRIDDNESNKEVLIRIRCFLGAIFDNYLKTCSVTKSKKYQIAKKIIQLDTTSSLEVLMVLSHTELRQMLAKIVQHPVFTPNKRYESKFLTYLNSLTRFIENDHPRSRTFKKLRGLMIIAYMALERVEASETYNKNFYKVYQHLIDDNYKEAMLENHNLWSIFKDLIYETVFMTLLGKPLSIKRFRKQVMSFLSFPAVALRVRLAPWQYKMRYQETLDN